MEADLVHGHGHHELDFPLDPTLGDDSADLFLPEEPEHDTINAHRDDVTTLDDAAVSAIKASLSQAQAASRAQDTVEATTINTQANGDGLTDHRRGSEENPVINPELHVAPYSREVRDDDTPLPQHLTFQTRTMFDEWLEAECSWCHFVQRRTTTPEKRAEERVKGRIKAHEKLLLGKSWTFPVSM